MKNGDDHRMTEKFEKLLDSRCDRISVTLTEVQKEQFFRYYELLIEKNRVMNLTAITEMADVIDKHFIDSLMLAQKYEALRSDRLFCIDVGTGAGFPGIPLKIAFPQLKIVLLDSLNKRVGFLNEVIEILGLKEISAVHGRAEDLGRSPEYRERFDLCVSRAVANLSTLSEYCMPFVRVGGLFVSYKSGKAEQEILLAENAVKKLGGEIESVRNRMLPGTEAERLFVMIRKRSAISKKYPRKAGTPSKEPL